MKFLGQADPFYSQDTHFDKRYFLTAKGLRHRGVGRPQSRGGGWRLARPLFHERKVRQLLRSVLPLSLCLLLATYMAEDNTCGSRRLSWLARSCFPDSKPISPRPRPSNDAPPSLASLPDDLLLDCLSRLPLDTLPSLSLVCRRFSLLLDSPSFLLSRRRHGLIHPSLFTLSLSDDLCSLSLSFYSSHLSSTSWHPLPIPIGASSLSHSRLVPLGRSIYLLSRSAAARLDTWTRSVTPIPATTLPHRKFAAAAIAGRIYVAGGATSAVEMYDPAANQWTVVAEVPRKRYGCLGVGAGGVFYVIGGLRIGDDAAAPHAYASSMDAYDVRSRAWLRTKGLPGAGCAVAACAAGGRVYVLASHAVEVSFWRWECGRRGAGGEWVQLTPPPVPAQVTVAGAMRYACVGVDDGTLALVLQMTRGDPTCRRRRRVHREEGEGWDRGEGAIHLYDIAGDEWRRGLALPPASRRSGFVAVEC